VVRDFRSGDQSIQNFVVSYKHATKSEASGESHRNAEEDASRRVPGRNFAKAELIKIVRTEA